MHAEIAIEEPSETAFQQAQQYPIYVIDRSSSGQTFVNAEPSGKDQRKALRPGDTLTFGADPVSYSLQWSPVAVSHSSTLPAEKYSHIQQLARRAGVFLTAEWTSNCTYLLMDQLLISPKLLCCIVDGGVPVASSFLEALAAREMAAAPPDPVQHQPSAPAGKDAAYANDLKICAQSPRTRHDILRGIWVIFSSQPAADAMSKALANAGAQAQFRCRSIDDVPSTVDALKQSRAQRGAPDEVWFVPHLADDLASALCPALLSLGAREYRAVPLPAIVVGLLKGNKEGVCSGASVMSLGKASKESYIETQQQQQQAARTVRPVSTKAGDVKCESFPHTQEQPPHPLTASSKMQDAEAKGFQKHQEPEPPAKRQKIDNEMPATRNAGFEAAPVKSPPPNSQEKPDVAVPGMAQTVSSYFRPMAQTVSSYFRPKSEAAGIDAPLTVPGETGLKQQDGDKLKGEVDAPPLASLSTAGGPSQGSGMPKILSINFDTPLTQPKPEDNNARMENKDAVAESLRSEPKVERQPKQEADHKPVAAAASDVKMGGVLAERTEQDRAPVLHPNGVWLPKTKPGAGKQEPFILQVPGMGEVDIHKLRPRTNKGAVVPSPARLGMQVSGGISRKDGAGTVVAKSGERRTTKVFRKSLGQVRPAELDLVPIAPWAPPAGQGLAEAFASHRTEPDSQLPPVW